MRYSLTCTLIAIFGLLYGCGASTPTLPDSVLTTTESSIAQTSNFDALLGQYKQALAQLTGKSEAQYPSDFALLKKMAAKLVELKSAEAQLDMQANQLESGEVPLALLQKYKSELTSLSLDKLNWSALNAELDSRIAATKKSVAAKQSQLGKGISLADKLVVLDDLNKLTGDPTWIAQRNTIIDNLVEEIRQAKKSGTLTTDLREKIEIIKENRAEDQELVEEMIAASAEIYKKDYFDAIGEGDADEAYLVFVSMKKSKDFDQIKASLTDSSKNMVDYFVALADSSVKDPTNLSQSYRWYQQARDVSETLGFESNAKDGETKLTEQLLAKYTTLKEQKLNTLAFAYLYFVQEFSPFYKGLRQMLQEQEDVVNSEAIKRISTTKFSGTEQQGYSDVISSNITQYMFTHIPNDVRIVEREQYEAILREKDLGGESNLSAVDLLVTGSILDAKVDNTETEGKKILRVTVGTEEIPNPAYISWLEMPARERKQVDQPSTKITVDKQENISVKLTKHRKVGIFSVSYRLVDAANGQIIFPDSFAEEKEYSDESREGVEMGEFKLEFKLADLPSDVKILDELAKKVSEEIGKRLVERLKDQDLRYLAEADEFASDKSCDREADRLAKALVIMKAKGKETESTFDRYKDVTINCPI